jgi:hypothetical protein
VRAEPNLYEKALTERRYRCESFSRFGIIFD